MNDNGRPKVEVREVEFQLHGSLKPTVRITRYTRILEKIGGGFARISRLQPLSVKEYDAPAQWQIDALLDLFHDDDSDVHDYVQVEVWISARGAAVIGFWTEERDLEG